MTYTNPNYGVVINALGGYRVLEKLGFKSEFQRASEERKAVALAKLREYLKQREVIKGGLDNGK